MRPRAIRWIRCGAEGDLGGPFNSWPECRANGKPSNVQAVYYELLPVSDDAIVTLGEGAAPLLAAPRMGAKIGGPNLYLKVESRNPTSSFKDRLAAAAGSAARELGRKVVVGSSSGNAGAAVAAMAARAGMPCVMFT